MPQLLVEDAVKAYDGKVAVDHVSFEVQGGEVFGLLGPNGAGKSTLIRMTMDILRPDSGRIVLAGRPSTDADHDRLRRGPRPHRLSPRGARPLPQVQGPRRPRLLRAPEGDEGARGEEEGAGG